MSNPGAARPDVSSQPLLSGLGASGLKQDPASAEAMASQDVAAQVQAAAQYYPQMMQAAFYPSAYLFGRGFPSMYVTPGGHAVAFQPPGAVGQQSGSADQSVDDVSRRMDAFQLGGGFMPFQPMNPAYSQQQSGQAPQGMGLQTGLGAGAGGVFAPASDGSGLGLSASQQDMQAMAYLYQGMMPPGAFYPPQGGQPGMLTQQQMMQQAQQGQGGAGAPQFFGQSLTAPGPTLSMGGRGGPDQFSGMADQSATGGPQHTGAPSGPKPQRAPGGRGNKQRTWAEITSTPGAPSPQPSDAAAAHHPGTREHRDDRPRRPSKRGPHGGATTGPGFQPRGPVSVLQRRPPPAGAAGAGAAPAVGGAAAAAPGAAGPMPSGLGAASAGGEPFRRRFASIIARYPHLTELEADGFDAAPAAARMYVIKSFSEDDVQKCIKYGVWASTDAGNRRLNQGFMEAAGAPVYLLYSVNGSGQSCGLARMESPVDFGQRMDFWEKDKWSGAFRVRWMFIKDIPNGRLRHITLPNNENKPVTNSRDTQEVPLAQMRQVLKIMTTHPVQSSLLEDFDFYEQRASELKAKKEKDRQRKQQREAAAAAGGAASPDSETAEGAEAADAAATPAASAL